VTAAYVALVLWSRNNWTHEPFTHPRVIESLVALASLEPRVECPGPECFLWNARLELVRIMARLRIIGMTGYGRPRWVLLKGRAALSRVLAHDAQRPGAGRMAHIERCTLLRAVSTKEEIAEHTGCNVWPGPARVEETRAFTVQKARELQEEHQAASARGGGR